MSTVPIVLEQRPAPSTHLVRHAGDTLHITLALSQPLAGQAFVRTNLGKAMTHRQEIIENVEQGIAPLGRDWNDLPMRKIGASLYETRLPLAEVGIFEFKCLFHSEDGTTIWPRGVNGKVKVVAAAAVGDNTIYNAFVRQFGENISGEAQSSREASATAVLDKSNYTVIPPSGTFRAFKSKLDFIVGEMGFRIVQFLPVHPTPKTFARMGRFGSPFAPLDFFDVDDAMADFDQRTTPLEQFLELVNQIHARGAMVFLDIPIDHTGWGSVLQSHHPEWFSRTADGAFESPGAWGVVWADLCKLDFRHVALWKALAEVFLHWCRNGVDGFRCDAGYMIPAPVWEYIVAKVRQEFPDTVFFLEGLGGGQDATTKLLCDAGLDWAYSEFFQNFSKQELSHYLEYATGYSAANGALVNFAETHDNDRLAAKSPSWARLRVAMAALFSPAGCFGIANGVEWFATEKIDVHEARSLNWGAQENQVAWISSLNALLKSHPAFWGDAQLRIPYGSSGDAVGLLRVPKDNARYTVLVIANPRADVPATYQWHFQEFDAGSRPVDFLTGRPLSAKLDECLYRVILKPGQVVCLCMPGSMQLPQSAYSCVDRQKLRAMALRLRVCANGFGDLAETDLHDDADLLFQSPPGFLKKLLGDGTHLPFLEWSPDTDGRRQTPLPENHYLLLLYDRPFSARIIIDGVVSQKCFSVPQADGRYFAFFLPHTRKRRLVREQPAVLHFHSFSAEGDTQRLDAPILLLPLRDSVNVLRRVTRKELTRRHNALLATTCGSYALVRGMWGNLEGQYDALLAVNQCPDYPTDRTLVLARMRGWVIHHDFSQVLGSQCQTDFAVTGRNTVSWHFIVPTGMGGNAYLGVHYELDREKNLGTFSFTRCEPPDETAFYPSMDADEPITLMLRPDVDDACTHSPTQAFRGAEKTFPKRVSMRADGFAFALESGNRLEARCSRGCFVQDGEWLYNVHGMMEENRGLRADRDLYSPGHFRLTLKRGETAVLRVAVLTPLEESLALPEEPKSAQPFHERAALVPLKQALEEALDAFVVHRKPLKTVIAGYPWFLDWGRDTLICLRGLIAAGHLEDAFAIIVQFASFEEHGTLPNMLAGDDVSNRETADAALWLFAAVSDYIHAVGSRKKREILETPCGDRTLLAVLTSIADGYLHGTPNGICVDPSSMLVFCPSHYTWMDTNYPAGTPREGYPIEIQALWFQALTLLAAWSGEKSYAEAADLVRKSVLKFYPSSHDVGFSDCLHATSGTPAAQAQPDDCCRPNQLFALTVPGLIRELPLREAILGATSHLMVPGAIRTLADQKAEIPLPIRNAEGHLLNNPSFPYWGRYEGDENTRRKPAYHNGSAWGWVMPSFCDAILLTYGEQARLTANAFLQTVAGLMRRTCLGQLPELLDGDTPHETRGCCAQAWSVTEAYRVLKLLEAAKKS